MLLSGFVGLAFMAYCGTKNRFAAIDLMDFFNQPDRDYCIGMISSRWLAKGANVCGAGGL